jgi:hypothetical protein
VLIERIVQTRRGHAGDELAHLVVSRRRQVHRADNPAHPQARRKPGLDVDVRCVVLDGELQQMVQLRVHEMPGPLHAS